MPLRVLIVGSGFFGAVCARELTDAGVTCHVIERRGHIGGNCYTRYHEDARCHEHVYGPHVFHTDSPAIWGYINRFASFNHFINRPRVRYQDQLYSFPINLLTLYQLYGVTSPDEARRALRRRRVRGVDATTLEGWCLATLGPELYEIFIRGYTLKQWGRDPAELPAHLIKRVPVRLTFDDNYYTDRFQGIPIGGYTAIFERLLQGIRVETEVDFLSDRDSWLRRYDRVIYTGPIDAFFEHCHGALDYRTLRFERETLRCHDYQGNAVVNYTDAQVPFTRIVEHKHFDMDLSGATTVITREIPDIWLPQAEPFYPVDTSDNRQRRARYQRDAKSLTGKVLFGGRLGEYRYYDMHQVIGAALAAVRRLLSGVGKTV